MIGPLELFQVRAIRFVALNIFNLIVRSYSFKLNIVALLTGRVRIALPVCCPVVVSDEHLPTAPHNLIGDSSVPFTGLSPS